MDRYIRNESMLSAEENRSLRKFRVAVAGCGGLGGYLIEMLARLGIGHLTVIDGDVFEPSNLNRQLLSAPENIGKSKAMHARLHVNRINPDIAVKAVQVLISESNAVSIFRGHDLVCDALDNIPSRKVVQSACEALGIPMVHAAIAGWNAQVATIMPGDRLLDQIYPFSSAKGAETLLGNPSFTPALAASLQVAEVLKILLHREGVLQHQLLVADTLNHIYEVIELTPEQNQENKISDK